MNKTFKPDSDLQVHDIISMPSHTHTDPWLSCLCFKGVYVARYQIQNDISDYSVHALPSNHIATIRDTELRTQTKECSGILKSGLC